ncbi:accessory gene regulator ArgB-like protein [Paenibacillus sp. sgz500958]|uniref:accessory gene regulator ArgB-like protein n=1 Tax=Paenibacillus sp. sgz500958 TaxID=3242475 RepID=UPI0036D3ADE3
MIDSLALRMAEGIKKRTTDHPASVAVLKHALAVIINTLSIIVFSILSGVLTGHLQEMLTILVAFGALRMISGGKHLRTGTLCVVVTTSLFTGMSLLNPSGYWLMSMNVVSILLVLLFAPSGIEKQSRIPRKYYPLLKWISALMVTSNLVWGSSILGVCFLVQALTLVSWRGGETP